MSRVSIADRLATYALCVLTAFPLGALATDLDDLPAAQLQAALDAELGEDDLRQFGIDPRKAYPLETLHEAILEAFSDEGDDDSEGLITQEELDDEMAEAGTDLSQVIWDALAMADREAHRAPGQFALRQAAWHLVREDGLTPAGTAATQSKLAVRLTIQRVRK